MTVLLVLLLRSWKNQIEAAQAVPLRQIELLDKLATLASVKDLEAYQGVMAMDRAVPSYDDAYDPSDEAQAAAEAARYGRSLEVERAEDEDALRNLF